jgi:hypothetical protein
MSRSGVYDAAVNRQVQWFAAGTTGWRMALVPRLACAPGYPGALHLTFDRAHSEALDEAAEKDG